MMEKVPVTTNKLQPSYPYYTMAMKTHIHILIQLNERLPHYVGN